jgi:competence protein ComEC
MTTHDAVFSAAVLFIFGVFIFNLGTGIFFALLVSFFSASLFCLAGFLNVFSKRRPREFFHLAALSISVIFGFLYGGFYSVRQKENVKIVFNEKLDFSAVVLKYPARGEWQDLVFSLEPPYEGKITARVESYPEFDYGDVLSVSGLIEKIPSGGYGEYLDKEGIAGTMGFPKAEFREKGGGSRIKSALFRVKERVTSSFEKNLPLKEANLLAGLTLGEQSGFDKEFKEKMKNSGTTHLVALSGYNISILAFAVFGLLGKFLKRRHSFFAVIIIISAFTVMAGAEASVVRAAVMGIILLLAEETGRIFSVRNAIAVAALAMVLFNPKVLNFDAGFQLSFIALFGLVYLAPALKDFFRAKPEPGILAWRENFWATVSAQAATLPVLIAKFGSFSPLSLISNVLILGFVPMTMFCGFVLGFSDMVFPWLSPILSLPAHILLSYEISVIDFFGKNAGIGFSPASPAVISIYYSVFILFVLYSNFNKKLKLTDGGKQ